MRPSRMPIVSVTGTSSMFASTSTVSSARSVVRRNASSRFARRNTMSPFDIARIVRRIS